MPTWKKLAIISLVIATLILIFQDYNKGFIYLGAFSLVSYVIYQI
ncbi:hypothetical protein [Candidatus Xianfuyuplasma coldseepsis]|nr:hypothetical protein [Xianfuyuplasma coldseepsis]